MIKPIRGSSHNPDHIMVSINGDACTHMAVTWRCSTDITSGYVLFREDGTDNELRCDASVELFVSDIDESNLFSVLLTNLKPAIWMIQSSIRILTGLLTIMWIL